MKKKLGTILIMFLCIAEVNSQHLVGLTQDNIMQKMQETSFVLDNSSKNTTFKYLKFVDKIEEKTLLVFLSENNICTSTKLMCDYSSYKETLNEFNKNYKKISSSEWNYSINNITYTVILKKEEWFYSVIVTTKNKKLWKLRNY